ncbi:MAG: hypothetical protein ABI650_04360, partial [Dokdonella sp.]
SHEENEKPVHKLANDPVAIPDDADAADKPVDSTNQRAEDSSDSTEADIDGDRPPVGPDRA